MSSVFRPLAAAMPEQVSSATTVYVAHDPSARGFGVKSGSVPAEQHTYWSGTSDAHSVGLLYVVKSLGETPHLLAKDVQLSPEATWTVLQSPRRNTRRTMLAQEVVLVPVDGRV